MVNKFAQILPTRIAVDFAFKVAANAVVNFSKLFSGHFSMCSARPSPRPKISATKIVLYFDTAKLLATFLVVPATFFVKMSHREGCFGHF